MSEWDVVSHSKPGEWDVVSHYGVIPGHEGEEDRVAQLKAQREAEPWLDKQLRKGQGQVEAMLNVGTGLLAPFQAIPAAAIKRALGMVPDVEKETARLMEEKTFQPRTQEGQDYAALVGKGFNELMALGPGNLSGLAQPRPIGAVGKPKAPKVAPVKSFAEMSVQERIDALKKQQEVFDSAPKAEPMSPWDVVSTQLGGDKAKPFTPFTSMVDQLNGTHQVVEPAFKMAPEEKPYIKSAAEAAADDATAARLQAAVDRQNPTRDPMQVTPEGQGITPNDLGTLTAMKRQLDAEQAHIEAQQAAMASQQASHLSAVEALQRQQQLREAQAAIEARQAALELEVKRKTIQDFNAAERARQEAAPTGHAAWVEQQRATAEQRIPGNNDPVAFTNEKAPYGLTESPTGKEGLPYDQPMLDKSLPLEVRDTLGTTATPDPFNRYSPNQAARRILIEGEKPPIIKTIGPRNQRGSSQMLTDIAQGIINLTKKLNRSVSPAVDYIASLPGMRSRADELITKPVAAKDMLVQARLEKDGPSLFNNLQSGLTLAADKMQSTMVKSAAQWFNWSHNRANYIIREAVFPLEKMFSKMGGKNLIDAYSVIHSEMFARREFTAAEIDALGLSPKAKEAYTAFRKVWDVIYNEENAQRLASGKSPLTKQDAYMSSIFRGDYHVPVYNKKGALVGYFQMPTKGGAKNAIAWIKEHYASHADVDVSGLKYDHKTMYQPGGKFGAAPRDVLSSWKDIAEALGDTPMAAQLQDAMGKWVAEKGTHAFSQDLHHTERKMNVRGFEGDQPWLGESKNAHNWAKAQIENMQQALRWSTAQEAVRNVKEMVTDPEIQKNQPNNIELTKMYMYDHMGATENMARRLESAIAGKAGISRQTVRNFTEVLRAGVYIKTLTASAGYAIATPFQAIAGARAWYVRELGEGNIKRNYGKFVADILDSAFPDQLPKFDKSSQEKLKWAQDNGIIQNVIFEEGASIGAHPAVDKVLSWANHTISMPDHWTRRMLFLPFANALEASGKFKTKQEAWRRAGELSDSVAVSMRQQDRPLAIKKLGMVGDMAYVFHAPVFNMYNNISAQWKYGKQTGHYSPLANYLGGLALVGGVLSLPLAKEISTGYDLFKELMAEKFPENYSPVDPKVEMLKALPDIKVFGNSIGENLSYGLASTMTGTDLRSRFSNEVIDTEQPLRSILPGTGVYGDMAKSGWNAATHPNANTAAQFAKDMAPGPVLRGLAETSLPQFKTQGQPNADKGVTSYRNPNDVDNPQAFVRRNPMETNYKRAGLTRLSEGIRREKDARWNAEIKRQETAKNNIADNLFKDIANGRVEDSKMAKGINKYIELGGDPKTLTTTIETKLKDMNFTRMENNTIKMKGYSKVMGMLQRLSMDQPTQ